MDQVFLVQLYLKYLPFCETERQKDRILEHVRELREEIVRIEEMTRSERNTEMDIMKLIIESRTIKPSDYEKSPF